MRRFSLLELATVVAILLTLTALAMPRLFVAQLEAKAAEMPLNTDGIIQAETAYEMAFGTYLDCMGNTPVGAGGGHAVPWAGGRVACYAQMGFEPDGDVYAVYWMRTAPGNTAWSANECYCASSNGTGWAGVTAFSDLDGDGSLRNWMACTPNSAVSVGLCSEPDAY